MITLKFFKDSTMQVDVACWQFKNVDEYLVWYNGSRSRPKRSFYAKVYSESVPGFDGTEFNWQ